MRAWTPNTSRPRWRQKAEPNINQRSKSAALSHRATQGLKCFSVLACSTFHVRRLLMRRQLADEATVVLIRSTRSVAELPRLRRLWSLHLRRLGNVYLRDLRNNGRWYYRSSPLRRNNGPWWQGPYCWRRSIPRSFDDYSFLQSAGISQLGEMLARGLGSPDVAMHLGHANGLITAAPHHDAIVESHVGPASSVLSHFEAGGSLSCHVQAIGIPIRCQKHVIGDGRVGGFRKRSIERHPRDSTPHLGAAEIFEPVFRARDGVQRNLTTAFKLHCGRFASGNV